jgi:formamidopyrimidine-DNA glycosylase
MTENEAKEVVKKLRNKAELFKNSGFAVDGIVKSFEDSANAIETLSEEIQQYRAIGTIEEFKALKEKNEPKKPRFYAHNYYCTECGNLVGNNEFEWQRFLYCDNCGQKLDWE